MKRCPQCDFIYEDDQGRCDMDGSKLECARDVPHRPHAATTRPPRPSAQGRRRLPALLVAGVILGVTLPSTYYVNTSQTATVPAGRVPADANATTAAAPRPETVAAPRPENTPVPEATAPQPEPPPEPPAAAKVRPPAAPSRKRTGVAAPAVRPAIKPPPPQPAEREARAPSPQNTNVKKESKLGAALKKTGRILKKPFGF